MTAWSLEPADITICRDSSLVLLYQAFTVALFSSCLLLGHFDLIEKEGQLDSGQMNDLLNILCLEKRLGCFWSCFWFTVHLHCEFWSTWLDLGRHYSTVQLYNCTVQFRIYPAASISGRIINKYMRTSSTGSHSCRCYTMWWCSLDHEQLYFFFKSFHYSGTSLSHQAIGYCFLRLTNGSHTVVKSLYVLCMSFLTVEFDTDIHFLAHPYDSWNSWLSLAMARFQKFFFFTFFKF